MQFNEIHQTSTMKPNHEVHLPTSSFHKDKRQNHVPAKKRFARF